MIGRLVVAIAYGVLVAIVILIVGVVLVATNVPILESVGKALRQWCWLLGLIAGVLSFFGGWSFPGSGTRPG